MRALCLALLLLAGPACAENAFRWVAEPGFDAAGTPHMGITPLKLGAVWGLMKADGSWLYEPQFDAVGTAGKGWFPVEKAGKWGVATLDGAPVGVMDFDAIGTPATYTPIRYQGQWWIVGPDGQFESAPLPMDEWVGNDDACVLGKRAGNYVAFARGLDPIEQDLSELAEVRAPSEGFLAYRLGEDWFQMSCADGSTVIGDDGGPFLAARPVREGKSAVQTAEGWGYAVPYGVGVEIGGTLKAAREFEEGLAPAQDDSGKWGFINDRADFVIPPQFDQAYSFSDGLAGVQIGDKRGFVAPDGRLVAEPQFDDFIRHDGGVVPVQQGGKWGVIAPAATDPATRYSLPLASLTTPASPGFTLVPSIPHYYVTQDNVSLHSLSFDAKAGVMITVLAHGFDAELALWDMKTHRLIRKIPAKDLTQAVLLPGTVLIAAGYASGHVAVLDGQSGAELFRIHPHKGAVLDMVLSPDGAQLATTDGQTVRLWSAQTGQSMGAVDEPAAKIRFSADSKTLYAASQGGGLVQFGEQGETLFRIDAAPTPAPFYPLSAAVPTMALGADGTLVIARNELLEQADGTYRPHNWLEVIRQSGTQMIDLPEGIDQVMSLDIAPDGQSLAYAGSWSDPFAAYLEVRALPDGAVTASQLLDAGETALAHGFDRFVYSLDRLAFAPDGALVLIGAEGTDILLVDPATPRQTASFATPLARAQNGTALIDGDRFFTTDGAGSVWVWNLATAQLERQVPIEGAAFGVEETLDPMGDRFALFSGLEEGALAVFDMTTLAQVPLSQEETQALLATVDYDNQLPYSEEILAQLRALPGGGARAVLAQGRIAVMLDPVGLHRAYDLKTGTLLAEFLTTPEGEWLIVTPEGFFAASPNGAKLVSVASGMHAFSVDQVYQALYRPDLVAAKLAGDPDGAVAKAAQELDLSRVLGSGPAPITRFSFPLDGFKAADPEIEVEAELSDEGGGIGRVEWRVNGLTVEVQPTRAAAALDDDAPKASARIALDPGQNVIEVVAYNAAGLLASAPRQVIVNWDGVASTEPPALYVLSVGVNDYADGRLQLKYAANDAKAFAEAMQKTGAGLFKSIEVVTLLDADVTEPKLAAAFAEMGRKVQTQDVFLFFLAGHGKTVEGKYYFIPQDFRFDGDDPFRAHGIDQDRWQEWAAGVKAKKSVMIYDTCESGSLTGTRSVDAAMAQSAAVERLTRAMGRTILSASTDDAPALEGYRGHGVMTWAMLDAMGAADTNGNATIEVTELANYLDLKVPEISAAVFGLRQVPQMSIKGSDFALGAQVAVLGDAPESFPATLTHVVAGGTSVLDGPGGAEVQQIPQGVFFGVFKAEEKDGFARIAKDGAALGWVPLATLTPLQ